MSSRILYVNTPSYTGGAEISLLTLLRNLDPARYVPLLVTTSQGQLTEQAQRYGIETVVQEFPCFRRRYPWRYPASILGLMRTIQQNHVVLVHSNCDHSLRYVRQACRLSRVPYVSHVRDFVRPWFQPSNLRALNTASAVVANSKAVATVCVDAGVNSSRVHLVYNPIDLAIFRQASKLNQLQTRCDLGLPVDAFIIGLIGQVQTIKGHSDLVDAAPLVVKEVPSAHFLIVGAAEAPGMQRFKGQLMQSLQDSGLTDRFHFMGFRDDIPQIIRSLDVLAVPSLTESFGRTVVEGLATGCPVIGTDVGGIPEIIRDGHNGLLIPPHDPHSLAGAITRLAEDGTLRHSLQQTGLRSVDRFSIEQHVDQIQTLYDRILSVT